MDKPLPCPCCAKELIERKVLDGEFNECPIWEHPDDGCAIAYITIDKFTLPSWNRRAPWTVTRGQACRAASCYIATVGTESEKLAALVEALGGKVEG